MHILYFYLLQSADAIQRHEDRELFIRLLPFCHNRRDFYTIYGLFRNGFGKYLDLGDRRCIESRKTIWTVILELQSEILR